MKKIAVLASLLTAMSLTNFAVAHPEHDDAPPVVLKAELVQNKDGALVYVTKGNEKVATAGATGKLTVVKGKVKQDVELVPSGENAMAPKAGTKLAVGGKAQATIMLADKSVATGEFVIK
ncbi:hypothetical protein F2P44_23770 [Massilia sp. CCM 8695]|uniref:Copper-binding protein n=1 Tax=Massilia frigida TaxID=2609281 RepID=A0ABX0ND55_9BURK|nr:hypothetical protein [Massilia frigida]NHZ82273.1 hypothetical protein [Massilia frigida]